MSNSSAYWATVNKRRLESYSTCLIVCCYLAKSKFLTSFITNFLQKIRPSGYIATTQIM